MKEQSVEGSRMIRDVILSHCSDKEILELFENAIFCDFFTDNDVKNPLQS